MASTSPADLLERQLHKPAKDSLTPGQREYMEAFARICFTHGTKLNGKLLHGGLVNEHGFTMTPGTVNRILREDSRIVGILEGKPVDDS